MKRNYELKSEFIKKLVENNNTKKYDESQKIKDYTAISLFDVIKHIKGISGQEFLDICEDINSGKVKVGMDVNVINEIVNSEGNEQEKQAVKKLIQNINIPMDIDLDGIKELGKNQLDTIKNMGCNIGRIYVNSGYDVSAERGYSVDVYDKIITTSEKALEQIIPKGADEQAKFMAIYSWVTKRSKYNDAANKENAGELSNTARNLEDFFVKNGSCVCAGTADVLKQLCDMSGIEAEYVQGYAQSPRETRDCYHAWIRVKLNGKWFNCDPTWDANKVGGKNQFCLLSDEEFNNNSKNGYHRIDTGYNPSYVRNTGGRYIEGLPRTYESSSSASADRSMVESYYDLDEKRGYNKPLSEQEAEYSKRNYIPMGSGIAPTSSGISALSIFSMIMNKLIDLTKIPSRLINKVKEKYSERIDQISTSETSKTTSEQVQNEYFEELRNLVKSENNKENINMEDKNSKSKSEINGESRDEDR